MLKLLIGVCIFTAFVKADYDFQDSDFNKLLIDDLTADADDEYLEPHRFKRGTDNETESAECRNKQSKEEKDDHCCKGDKGDPNDLKAIKAVKAKCVADVRGANANEVVYDPLSCDGVTKMKQQMVCVIECKAKSFDLLTENGDFKRDALVSHVRRVYGAHKWKASVLEGYVDKCLSVLQAAKDSKQKVDSLSGGCNPNPLDFYHCIWKSFVEGCPAELQINSKNCKKIRNRVAKGDVSAADKSLKRMLRA